MPLTLSPSDGNGDWQPQTGSATQAFIEKKSMSGIDMTTVTQEASDILSRCASPSSRNSTKVVLAVGYVQSGKTLSFTTLASLARDNQFGLVILIAGTKNNLKSQSEDRLVSDLDIDHAVLQKNWITFANPGLAQQAEFDSAIVRWRRASNGTSRFGAPSILVTLLKNETRLANTAKLLQSLEMSDVPTLIIDDESDQASPNTRASFNLKKNQSEKSPTNAAILDLRASLPLHSYVQYTATPHANLLAEIADTLNPDAVKVLSAGAGYTGGQAFFRERSNELIREIPDEEVFHLTSPPDSPPESLLMALRVFVLGVADTALKSQNKHRSMMIQPHQVTWPHRAFAAWVGTILSRWQNDANTSPELDQELIAEFTDAHQDLGSTVPDLEPLEKMISHLDEIVSMIQTREINSTSGQEEEVLWSQHLFWILIGGNKLDRGFTVEGLTVTYMPRPVSISADVLQQRARFFGYREPYIDYCRVFLPAETINSFTEYVHDEEDLRDQLKSFEGRPLRDWKRQVSLADNFRTPTRTSVIGRHVSRKPARKREWSWAMNAPMSGTRCDQNRELYQAFLSTCASISVVPMGIETAVDMRKHPNVVYGGINSQLVKEFLMSLNQGDEDRQQMRSIIESLRDGQRVTVVFMNGLRSDGSRGRDISVLRQNIHAGRSPAGNVAELRYSGDSAFISSHEATLQLRVFDVKVKDQHFRAVPWWAWCSRPQELRTAVVEYD